MQVFLSRFLPRFNLSTFRNKLWLHWIHLFEIHLFKGDYFCVIILPFIWSRLLFPRSLNETTSDVVFRRRQILIRSELLTRLQLHIYIIFKGRSVSSWQCHTLALPLTWFIVPITIRFARDTFSQLIWSNALTSHDLVNTTAFLDYHDIRDINKW